MGVDALNPDELPDGFQNHPFVSLKGIEGSIWGIIICRFSVVFQKIDKDGNHNNGNEAKSNIVHFRFLPGSIINRIVFLISL